MKKAKDLWFNGGLIAILIGVFLVYACSDNKILNNPSDDQQTLQDLAAINAVDLARERLVDTSGLAKPEGDTYLIAKTEFGFEITSSASTASFMLDGNRISIAVPANAFDKSKWGERLYIYIRAEKWNTSTGSTVSYYECTPGGVVFNSPLKITQPYENKVSGKQNLYFKNPISNTWVTADSQSLLDGQARFSIDHFSKYAISD